MTTACVTIEKKNMITSKLDIAIMFKDIVYMYVCMYVSACLSACYLYTQNNSMKLTKEK